MAVLSVDSDELMTWVQAVSDAVAITKVALSLDESVEVVDERLTMIMNALDAFVKHVGMCAQPDPGGSEDV